jgi:hypothetical protein
MQTDQMGQIETIASKLVFLTDVLTATGEETEG